VGLYIYAISCGITFFCFGTSILYVFVQHKEHHRLGYFLLKLGNISVWLSTFILIYLNQDIDQTRWTLGSVLQIICLFFFLSLKKMTKKKLTIAFSKDTPKQIFKSGPYKYIRHPYYTCYLISYFSAFLAIPNYISAFNFLFMVIIYTWAAKIEENKFIKSTLKNEYLQYMNEAGMFWPFIKKI
jgi:protein-S-isoprenylcysteine O-methyltransferase Ste14